MIRDLLCALADATRPAGTDTIPERLDRAADELVRFARGADDHRAADLARMVAADLRGMVCDLEVV